MPLRDVLSSPAIVNLTLLVACGIWVLKDERDKSRRILFLVTVVNLIYPVLFSFFMAAANSVLHWKYDYYLSSLDRILGVSSNGIALAVQPAWPALRVVYYVILPAMIFWLALNRKIIGVLARAYAAEFIVGPAFYPLLPAGGPLYAFGNGWTHSPVVQAKLVRLAAAPINAFPSLHLASAFLFVLTARSWLWRGIALVFFAATGLATLTTGEHYVIDLVPGLVFGCFLLSLGKLRIGRAIGYLAVTVAWSVAIRFGVNALLAHPAVVQLSAVSTALVAGHGIWAEWRSETAMVPGRKPGHAPSEASPAVPFA